MSIHLILGDEEFLVARELAQVVADAHAKNSECDVVYCIAAELTVGDLATLLSPSLFAEHRVVVVKQAQDALKQVATALLEYLPLLDAPLVLVIAHAGGAKNKALVDGIRQTGAQVHQCPRITKYRDRLAFVREEITRQGGRCLGQTAELILESVGGDLRELSNACGQLVADTGGTVDAAAVRRYYRGRAEVTGFAVADAVMVGDQAGALEAIRWAGTVGVDPVLIADAMADGVRSVARVAAAGNGGAAQLASVLGMPPWKVERAQRQARGWTPQAITDAMGIAARLNAAVKGAAEDRVYVLERAVLAMVASKGANLTRMGGN